MNSQIDQERSNRYLKTKNARHCCNRLWTYRLSNQSQTFYHNSRKFLYFYIVYKYSTVLIIFEIFLDSQISSLIKLWIGWAETKRLTAWIQRMICRSNTFINYKFKKKTRYILHKDWARQNPLCLPHCEFFQQVFSWNPVWVDNSLFDFTIFSVSYNSVCNSYP